MNKSNYDNIYFIFVIISFCLKLSFEFSIPKKRTTINSPHQTELEWGGAYNIMPKIKNVIFT